LKGQLAIRRLRGGRVVHARSLAEVSISSKLSVIGCYTSLVLEAPVRRGVDDSWNQNAQAKKILWKSGRRHKTISIEAPNDKNRHCQSDK